MNNTTNTITIENLHKKFDDHEVLKGVSLTAPEGSVVALLGSSGSGKSTLLRCINLLEAPNSGKIQMDQDVLLFGPKEKPIPPKKIIELRTKVGMVFQQFNLWMHLTILENLILAPIHVLKIPKKKAIAQAEALLAKVGISNKQNQYPSKLSGGQQQRAAIARALMMNPKIMLFDEPTSALDPEMVNEVLQVIQSLAAEGMTMIIASHEIRFVKKTAKQIIFLEEGKILEQGSTEEIFKKAKTERLQRFLDAVQHE